MILTGQALTQMELKPPDGDTPSNRVIPKSEYLSYEHNNTDFTLSGSTASVCVRGHFDVSDLPTVRSIEGEQISAQTNVL